MARGHSDLHKFPLQYPTRADHSLWKAAIRRISSLFYTFPTPLGRYIDLPHKTFSWITSNGGDILHQQISSNLYRKFDHTAGRQSQSGAIFSKSYMQQGISPLTSYVSATFLSDLHVCLHSWTGLFSPSTSTSSFWDQIGLYDNHSLW
jgi:hypothetical protein